jgi:pimeloyl-ACP methyl ester carboxylesterase
VSGKFALFTHGWMGSSAGWIEQFNGNLSIYRPGCIIFMNYSFYGDDIDYFRLVSRFENISRVMVRKLNQLRDEGVSADNIYMFGFSYGGRLVIESGIQFGKSEISSIDGKNEQISKLKAVQRNDFLLKF